MYGPNQELDKVSYAVASSSHLHCATEKFHHYQASSPAKAIANDQGKNTICSSRNLHNRSFEILSLTNY